MIKKAVQEAINEQIKNEMYSSYLYLAMQAHFTSANLNGFANWMKVQSSEESIHAMKLYNFLLDRGGQVVLQAIAQPPSDFKSPREVMAQVYEHEQHVTASIHKLYEVATKEMDYPTQVMLHWFINEQVEEEKNASEIVERLKVFGDNPAALFEIDQELKGRGAAPAGAAEAA